MMMAVTMPVSNAISIPPDVLEQAARGNLLLFLGERSVRDADGNIAIEQWVGQLADRCGLSNAISLSFPEVAQVYEDAQGRAALVQFVRDQLVALSEKAQPVHTLIAELI